MKKRNVKNALAAFFSATLVVLAAFALVSCDNELDVQQEYPFTVETMPVLHLSEAAVSPVWQWLFTKVSRQLHVSENPDSSGRRYGFFRPLAKILP